LTDLLFPKSCLGCRKQGHYFCPQCQEEIRPLGFQMTPVTAFFPYKGLIKKAMVKLKYRFMTDLGDELVALMIKIIREKKDLAWFKKLNRKRKVILIPLPLHPKRENWRGFNQSELLGEKLAKALGWQLETQILVRQKNTQPQVSLRSEERKQNVQGSFVVSPQISSNLKRSLIILFDDVWTTGSTMLEAEKVLRKAGFKKIFCLTVCR